MAKIRGTHSSPGVYTQFTDLSYAAKSLGITTLGLVGETKKGPAFEPIPVSNWEEYQSYFGGTSAEIFSDSKYPKYELPYIAKTYLSKTDQLYVCRVLGLSGYNAGPAWIITAEGATNNKHVVAVLRSRGQYTKYAKSSAACSGGDAEYDVINYACDRILIEPTSNIFKASDCGNGDASKTVNTNIDLSLSDFGTFTIIPQRYVGDTASGDAAYETVGTPYAVSFNAGSKDYIYNVLGANANEGDAPVYIEELYDVRLRQLVENHEVTKISIPEQGSVSGDHNNAGEILKVNELKINAIAKPVAGFVEIPSDNLTKKYLGQTYLCNNSTSGFKAYDILSSTGEPDIDGGLKDMVIGHIYVVKTVKINSSVKKIAYVAVSKLSETQGANVYSPVSVSSISQSTTGADTVDAVKMTSCDMFFHLNSTGNQIVTAVDMSNYHESFRCASTPWFVSELRGNGDNIDVKKLFRFHTISDGTNANNLYKVSIANIRPEEGTFDVIIRDFNDNDSYPSIIESYKGVNMVPGSPKYIGLKIGTLDGSYESKSKCVMVEVIENDVTRNCVPCGFLGYPVRDFASIKDGLTNPTLVYNTEFTDAKVKKQYFGMGDIDGAPSVDVDILNYKGKSAYLEDYKYGYTNPFHLDSTINEDIISSLDIVVTIDGDETTSGLTWETVNPNFGGELTGRPVIGSEAEMAGTIYENVNVRKFTAFFYGGFDGWDVYRSSRTNTNEYKSNAYKGHISNGNGSTFSVIDNPAALGLDGNAITSDYYAYLAGYNQFEIPERYIINLFATPGIDYVNNSSLVNEVYDMIEDKRGGDVFYVVTTPDKPWGASDARDEMYTSTEAADNLEESGIDTYFSATYYPWVKYYDADNAKYINLPVTKDVLRNMANVDNKLYPWYAPAGIERGNVECERMHFFAKLEDEDNVYDARINPVKTFSEDGVKIWGNKTMYTGDTPMNRINVVRLMLYMRKLVTVASRKLIFDPNDATLKAEFENLINPILTQIKNDRGITAYKLVVSQTEEEMDAHELNCTIWVKPTPALEWIQINFVVTPQGVSFE